ncbi:hypothetical protein [Streptomyces pseudovenezuelae]|uniref:hypothetical protein n=1 Tax=Streptomyces pseudovenezuelae TaxID=67350 RepID=UPI002E80F52E|nr:hypothetical protein [Streptomyces pseudovenezuelae]WUA94016.1 hypothetical protein OHO81_03780 [Streptomyces pseudovenezuelae]
METALLRELREELGLVPAGGARARGAGAGPDDDDRLRHHDHRRAPTRRRTGRDALDHAPGAHPDPGPRPTRQRPAAPAIPRPPRPTHHPAGECGTARVPVRPRLHQRKPHPSATRKLPPPRPRPDAAGRRGQSGPVTESRRLIRRFIRLLVRKLASRHGPPRSPAEGAARRPTSRRPTRPP